MTTEHPLSPQFDRFARLCSENHRTNIVEAFDGSLVSVLLGSDMLNAFDAFNGHTSNDMLTIFKQGVEGFNIDNVVGLSLFLLGANGEQIIHQAHAGQNVISMVRRPSGKIEELHSPFPIEDAFALAKDLDLKTFARRAVRVFQKSAEPRTDLVDWIKVTKDLVSDGDHPVILVDSDTEEYIMMDHSKWAHFQDGFNASEFLADFRQAVANPNANITGLIQAIKIGNTTFTLHVKMDDRTIESGRLQSSGVINSIRRPSRIGRISSDPSASNMERAISVAAIKLSLVK